MTGKEQLHVLSFVLPKLMEEWKDRVRHRHYRAGVANPTATTISQARISIGGLFGLRSQSRERAVEGAALNYMGNRDGL